jgi:hypothetical protein
MRRLVALAVCASFLVAAAPAGAAKVRTYKGALGEGTIVLKATKKKVRKISFGGFKLDCSDGDSLTYPGGSGRAVAISEGAFVFEGTNSQGWSTAEIDGVIGRKRAKGSFELLVRFNEQNEPDAHGDVTCSTELGWKAKRVRKKKKKKG